MGYSRLQQVTEWLQWVTAGYSKVTELVTVGYSRSQQVAELLQWVTVRLQQFTELLQWDTAVYSKLPSGYSGLQKVAEWLPSGL